MREHRKSKGSILSIDILSYLLLAVGMLNILLISTRLSLSGSGYFGVALMCLFLLTEVFSNWITNFVAKYIKGRNSRKQYINVNHFFRGAAVYTIAMHLFVAVLLFLMANMISSFLFQDIHIAICIRAMLLVFLLMGLRNVLQGFFKGMGILNPVRISMIIQQIGMFAFSFLFVNSASEYGSKVASLLRSPDVAYIYGACFALVGFAAGVLCGIVTMLICMVLLFGEFHQMVLSDTSKYPESVMEGIKTIFVSGVFYVAKGFFIGAPFLLDYILYIKLVVKTSAAGSQMIIGGSLFGIVFPLIMIFVLLYAAVSHRYYKGITGLIRGEQYNMLRDKINGLVMSNCILCLPFAIIITVLGEPIFRLLTGSSQSFGIMSMNYAGVYIFAFSFEMMLLKMISKMFENSYSLLCGAAGFIVQTISCIVCLKVFDLGELSILIAPLIQCILICLLAFMKLKAKLHFSLKLFRQTILGIICALAAGILILCIYQFLGKSMTDVVSLIVCTAAYLIIYLVLIVVLQVVPEAMYEHIPGGRFFVLLNNLYHRQ